MSGQSPQADRGRLPGGALPRRNPQEHAGSGCRGRHRRVGGHSGRRRPGTRRARRPGSTAAFFHPPQQHFARRRRSARVPGPFRPRSSGRARRPSFPSISTTTPRRACWRPRNLRPTSRSPKAATIPAASASFPIFAANFARGVSHRWSPRPNNWSPRACANSR